ncbi:MAG TPA: Crp/Fnr family transcriptional regulator [Aestuariivirga sp.]|nr:Crp/Fnr family transcriptional regulator [Aestuariivirga sp.]
MVTISQSSVENRLLALLPKADFEVLAPGLELLDLPARKILHEPNESVEFAYFPTAGICSVIAENAEGVRSETGVIGKEGFIGIPIVLFAGSTPAQVVVQVEGRGLRMAKEDLQAAMIKSPALLSMLLRFTHIFSVQTSQTAVANSHYTINQRLARWLLMCQDRTNSHGFTMTHEFIAVMLAVRRSGVTEALNEMEGLGIVRTTRAHISIVKRRLLEEIAGGAYGVPEQEYRRLIPHT